MFISFIYVFLIILVIQVVFFIFAAINKTDKVTDLSYGLTFIIASTYSLYLNSDNLNLFKYLIFAIIVIWGIRLSTYLFIRILTTKKDKRFDGIRENPIKFGMFWLLQAVSVFLILLPTTYAILDQHDNSISFIQIFGIIFSLLGILIEGIADQQKFIFKEDPKNQGLWIQTGVWRYSRHPNYLGEIMMWVGVALSVLPLMSGLGYLTLLSPLYITFLLVKVSGIPTLERQYEQRYANNEEYKKYKENTGILLPKIFKIY